MTLQETITLYKTLDNYYRERWTEAYGENDYDELQFLNHTLYDLELYLKENNSEAWEEVYGGYYVDEDTLYGWEYQED